jgi:hypothetical protein
MTALPAQRVLTLSENHLYFICQTRDTTPIGSKTYYQKGISSYYIYGEIDTDNGNIKWSDSYVKNHISGRNHTLIGILRLKGSVYIEGHASEYTSNGKMKLGSDTISTGSFIVKLDSLGNYTKHYVLQGDTNRYYHRTWFESFTSDGEYLYSGGSFTDSIQFGKIKVGTSQKLPVWSVQGEIFAASFTKDLEPRWFYRPDVISRHPNHNGAGNFRSIVCSNGYIYYGGINEMMKLRFDSTVVNNYETQDLLIFKMDFLGNVLWATGGDNPNIKEYCYNSDLSASDGESVFAAGYFTGTMTLGPHKKKSKSMYHDGWVTKISDNSITRGKVKSGPYCAGDTILIPYTLFGNFDSANTFIAQLSDEEGNFNKSARELGRLNAFKDSVIKGVLPMFNVSSSGNYRIRILSNKPGVQSYYLRDSLRLLIYSRDKANPGLPETICPGDTLQLNTYGGTQWKWSPKLQMNDSTLRQPKVWPKTTATYKIIISDSSGCGAPDTAYKTVIVREQVQVIPNFTDTSVCNLDPIKISVNFAKGDSNAYSWQWYFVVGPKNWFAGKKGSSYWSDDLNYTPSMTQGSSETIAIVINDQCSFKTDTSLITIRFPFGPPLHSSFRDTLLCQGNRIVYKVGSYPAGTLFQWTDLLQNSVLSNSDSLSLIAQQTRKIQFVQTNGCSTDTAIINLVVNPPLQGNLLISGKKAKDTTLCYGQSIQLNSIGKGGQGSGFNYRWFLDTKEVSNSDTFILNTANHFGNTAGKQKLSLKLSDNCGSKEDSVSINVQVLPSPKADFTYALACNKTPIKFVFTGSVPASPVMSSYLWKFPDGDSSTLKDPSKLITQTGIKNIRLKVSSNNGCSEVVSKDIDVKLQAKAGYTARDVCESDSAVFVNTSQQGVSYLWRFGDGNTSKQVSPKHLYAVGGQSTTFNVTLIASVPLGCSDSIVKAVTINANPSSDFDYTILTAGKIDLSAKDAFASQYRWILSTGDTLFSKNIQISNSFANKQVCLKVTNAADCFSKTCKIIFPLKNQLIEKGASLLIIPNPNNGSFSVEWPASSKSATMEIINSLGQIVYKETIISPQKSNLNLKPGVYTIQILQDKTVWMDKIVVVY